MAGAVGIEPTLAVLETAVLPLNYAPVVGTTGFEPATSPTPRVRATELRHVPTYYFIFGAEGGSRTHTPFGNTILSRARLPIPPLRQLLKIALHGVPGETRTPNLLIRSQTLYPIELRAHVHK